MSDLHQKRAHTDPAFVARIANAVEALPPEQRAIFLAVRDESITYAALAARLGITVDAVERTFVVALVALANAADE